MTPTEQLSSLARLFLSSIPETLEVYRTGLTSPILRIPAINAHVGDLTVYDEDLTVMVGKEDHRHFGMEYESDPKDIERQRRAVELAIRWILDILADRIRFRHQYSNGRLIASGDWNQEEEPSGVLLGQADEYREYTWSGQKLHKKVDRTD